MAAGRSSAFRASPTARSRLAMFARHLLNAGSEGAAVQGSIQVECEAHVIDCRLVEVAVCSAALHQGGF